LPTPFTQNVQRVRAIVTPWLTLCLTSHPLYSFHRVAVKKTIISELLRLVLVCLNR